MVLADFKSDQHDFNTYSNIGSSGAVQWGNSGPLKTLSAIRAYGIEAHGVIQ